MKRLLQTSALVGAVVSLVLSMAGCGASGTNGATAAGVRDYGGADPNLVKLVPADIHAKGKLAGGASFDTRPMNFYAPGNKPDGVIIDLVNAAGAKLGLTIDWPQVPYAGLIPALQSKRVEIAGAQITKTNENNGVVNLLAFYQASSSLLVAQGHDYHAETDACGSKFGLTTGSTINQNIADSINEKCKAAGKPLLQYLYFPSFNAAQDAVRSGRIDSILNSTPQILLATKADKTLGATLVGQLSSRPTGIALPKEYTELTQAFKAAFEAMMADGSYRKILDKWELGSMATD